MGLKEEKEQLDAKKEKKAKRSGSEIEESERSSVDIDNTLDPDGEPARRILSLGVTQRPPVVTRFGGVVKVGYLEK